MALLGLLRFVLASFDLLAWPLFALLYPLYSSIRAIETNSTVDTHKLNTYWVVFSLVLLFEHACSKLLEWFLLWPYIKLLIVLFLVMPHFDGALYVYKHLIYPCLSMDPHIVIEWFNKRKVSFLRDNLLTEVERYVKENGTEGLEKIIACKSKSINPNGGQNDVKPVQEMAKKKETTASEVKVFHVVSQAEPNVTMNVDKLFTTKINQKAIKGPADREILNTPLPMEFQELSSVSSLPTQTDATFNSPLGDHKHKSTYEALTIKNEAEPKLTWTEKRTVAAMETTEKREVRTDIEDPEPPKEIQKEWTCALCQISTTCESNLHNHLQGRKHKAAYEALKVRNQAVAPKIALASTVKTSDQPNNKPGMSTLRNGSKQKVTVNEKVQGQKNSSPAPPVTKKHHKSKEELADCVSSSNKKGKTAMHVEKVQSQQTKLNEVLKVKSSRFWCPICNIHCPGEVDMASHLKGKKHKENVQERKPK